MEINIFDYVTEDEIRAEILSGIKYKAINMTEDEFTRVMTNAFYDSVSQLADEVVEEKGYEFDMRVRIKKIIQELTGFTVFRPNDFGKANKNSLLLEKIVKEEEELLRQKVIETFDNAYKKHEASQDIATILSDHVYNMFSQPKKTNKDGRPS